MKGNSEVIKCLNDVLMVELTAINTYYIHHKMEENSGYEKLAHHSRSEALNEMKHADKIIGRVLYLEGVPNMSKYEAILVGDTSEDRLKNQYTLETAHVKRLQKYIALCHQKNDFGTKELLDEILKDTENHCDWLETQFQRIHDIGIKNYLAENMHE